MRVKVNWHVIVGDLILSLLSFNEFTAIVCMGCDSHFHSSTYSHNNNWHGFGKRSHAVTIFSMMRSRTSAEKWPVEFRRLNTG